MVAIFGVIYTGSGYNYDNNVKEQRLLTKDIEDLRNEYLSISAKLTQMKRCSVIEDSVSVQDPDLRASRTASFLIGKH